MMGILLKERRRGGLSLFLEERIWHTSDMARSNGCHPYSKAGPFRVLSFLPYLALYSDERKLRLKKTSFSKPVLSIETNRMILICTGILQFVYYLTLTGVFCNTFMTVYML